MGALQPVLIYNGHRILWLFDHQLWASYPASDRNNGELGVKIKSWLQDDSTVAGDLLEEMALSIWHDEVDFHLTTSLRDKVAGPNCDY